MASNIPANSIPNRRNNDIWVAELRGDHGTGAQNSAHVDLGIYLYAVIYAYLQKKSTSVQVLTSFTAKELAELAEDFVQDTLEKLSDDSYALLNQYEGRGAFTSWVAPIGTNIAATELRRPYWNRRTRPGRENLAGDDGDGLTSGARNRNLSSPEADTDPEAYTLQKELGKAIQECRGSLTERYGKVFDQIIVNENPVEDLANELGISANAVYVLVSRVKRKMRKCLTQKGLHPHE